MLQNVKKVLANTEPSTQGTKKPRTMPGLLSFGEKPRSVFSDDRTAELVTDTRCDLIDLISDSGQRVRQDQSVGDAAAIVFFELKMLVVQARNPVRGDLVLSTHAQCPADA